MLVHLPYPLFLSLELDDNYGDVVLAAEQVGEVSQLHAGLQNIVALAGYDAACRFVRYDVPHAIASLTPDQGCEKGGPFRCSEGKTYHDEEIGRIGNIHHVHVWISRDEGLQVKIAEGSGYGQHTHHSTIWRHEAAQIADAFLWCPVGERGIRANQGVQSTRTYLFFREIRLVIERYTANLTILINYCS